MFWDDVKQFRADKLVKFIKQHEFKAVYSPERNKIRCLSVSFISADRFKNAVFNGRELKIERINNEHNNGWKISELEDIEPTFQAVRAWLGY